MNENRNRYRLVLAEVLCLEGFIASELPKESTIGFGGRRTDMMPKASMMASYLSLLDLKFLCLFQISLLKKRIRINIIY